MKYNYQCSYLMFLIGGYNFMISLWVNTFTDLCIKQWLSFLLLWRIEMVHKMKMSSVDWSTYLIVVEFIGVVSATKKKKVLTVAFLQSAASFSSWLMISARHFCCQTKWNSTHLAIANINICSLVCAHYK